MYEQQRRGKSAISVVASSAKQPVSGATMQIIETSDEPLTFEVGAGEVMGNKMFQVAVSC